MKDTAFGYGHQGGPGDSPDQSQAQDVAAQSDARQAQDDSHNHRREQHSMDAVLRSDTREHDEARRRWPGDMDAARARVLPESNAFIALCVETNGRVNGRDIV